MHKIKEKLMDEIYDIEEKMKKANGKVSAGDLEYIHKLTDTVKNIDKIEMLEEGYSENSKWMSDGGYEHGNSYGRKYAKRDSTGRYSRDGYRMSDRYSMNDGREQMLDKLEEMMHEASTEKERNAFKQFMHQLKSM